MEFFLKQKPTSAPLQNTDGTEKTELFYSCLSEVFTFYRKIGNGTLTETLEDSLTLA